jgi:hypothetical protein
MDSEKFLENLGACFLIFAVTIALGLAAFAGAGV